MTIDSFLNKKLFFSIILGLFLIPCFVFAQKTVEIDFFYGNGCPHCADEQNFLNILEQKYPEVKINYYSINDLESRKLLTSLCVKHDVKKYLGSIPMTFINEDFILGFNKVETTGIEIEDSIKRQLKQTIEKEKEKEKIHIPILGEVDAERYSLPVLTIILGTLDGFNVCSLGALVFILGMVLAFRSKKKTLLFGGIFIITSAITYGLLMILWYQLFSLLGAYIKFMHILIGVIAISGGLYFFKQFLKFQKRGVVCAMNPTEGITSKLTSNIQKIFKNPKNTFTIIGATLAFAILITITEFPCSAITPVIYTGILAQADLSSLQYTLFIALFVLFYMIDEFIVFLVAVFTMKLWLTSQKFITYATLIGAIILISLGSYYLLTSI